MGLLSRIGTGSGGGEAEVGLTGLTTGVERGVKERSDFVKRPISLVNFSVLL